jgi:hypothetical protein
MLVTATLSIVLVMLPVFGVLYWFAYEHNSVPLVLLVHLAALAVAIVILLRQLTVHTVVTDTEIRGRGIFSPMVHVPLDRIAAVDLVPTYVGQTPEPVVQLLLRDAQGKRLFRMRGNFWHPGDLERIAESLPVHARVGKEPMPLREFFSAYPGSAYWFENRPAIVAVLLAVAIVASLATAAWVMTILEMPLGFS